MNVKSLLLVTGLASVAVGFVAGQLLQDPQHEPVTPVSRMDKPASAELENIQGSKLEQPSLPARPQDSSPREAITFDEPASDDSELFSSALLAHFNTEFTQAWSEQRSLPASESDFATGEERFKTTVLALPSKLGRKMAETANKADIAREALATGDGMLIVEACAEGSLVLDEATLSGDLFERVLAARVSGKTIDGSTLTSDGEQPIFDGMVLKFGRGMHKLSDRALRRQDSQFPTDLVITGAGINSTLLTIDTFGAREQVQRLHIRDLTLDCGNNYLFDLRRGALSIDLENVRIVRFDMGAGGSLIFGTNQGTLLRARGCEFLGGFGRHPGSGNLWRGEMLVASFSDCRFSLLDLNVDSRYKIRAVFTGCMFENFLRDPSKDSMAIFKYSNILPLLTHTQLRELEPRTLAEFFPAWTPR